jgi:hypothetical protein
MDCAGIRRYGRAATHAVAARLRKDGVALLRLGTERRPGNAQTDSQKISDHAK